MNFEWTEEERAGRDRIAALLDADERARLAAAEDADAASLREAVQRSQRRLGDAGYWKIALGPAEDAHTLARVAMDLELARASSSFFLAFQATRHLAGLVAGWGSAALRTDLLASLLDGGTIGAVVLPEAGGVADGTPTVTAANGGGWTLRGARPFVANGPIADWLAVFADAGGKTLVGLVRPEQPNVRRGERLRLVGLGGLATCAVELDGVRLAADRVLGPFDDAAAATWCRRSRDLGLAVAGVGLMRRTFEAAKTYAQGRQRGGKPIVFRQEIGFKLAELLTLAQTAELLVDRAAWMVGTGDPEADTLVRCAKVFCAENAERVASAALQVLAGHGCIAGNEVERAWRDAKAIGVLGTTVEVARMAVADELLARP